MLSQAGTAIRRSDVGVTFNVRAIALENISPTRIPQVLGRNL